MNFYEEYETLLPCTTDISSSIEMLENAFLSGNKLLLCGNGGSNADCEHISGELLKGFLSKREISENDRLKMKQACPNISDNLISSLQYGLPSVNLGALTSFNTAFGNDVNWEYVFSQGVFALGKKGDILVCISTSGNSKNCVYATQTAKAIGMNVISLTGKDGGKLNEISDICIKAPEKETLKIQQMHEVIYHYICMEIEKRIFD